ncbi:MAG: glycosyltransferase, partial [Patescibacteria group bacterium]|nr:glycosyltransferase [Patescibacteria group bacterium]
MAKKRLKTNLPYPYISVVVFSRPNESPIKALDALKRILYPKNLYEIVVLKGSHLSKQRNLAIHETNGKIVYLLDNDSQVQPNALSIIQQTFTNKKISAVGGPSISPENETTYLSKLIGYILETHFGALRMRLRYSKTEKKRSADEFHLIGANLALRKKAVQKCGGFNEKITPNEETELLARMKKKGYSLSYNPQLFV